MVALRKKLGSVCCLEKKPSLPPNQENQPSFQVMQQIKMTGQLPDDLEDTFDINQREIDLFFEAIENS